MARQVIAGGLVLTPDFTAVALDIVIDGDSIAALVPRGTKVDDARIVDAAGKAVIPGLVNGHVHGHATLAKGRLGDRWPLELFLNALPGLGANRVLQDKHLNGLLNAVEMVRKGSTSCYDMFFEFPQPSAEGLFAVGEAYSAVGVRAVLAPMVADRTFYGAYPELMETVPEPLRAEAMALQMASTEASLAGARAAFAAWPFDRDRIRPGIAPTIPLHCSDEFLVGCGALAAEFDLAMQTHLAESKTQAIMGLERYGCTLTAHLETLGLLGPHLSAAHAIWIDDADMRILADHGCTVVHTPPSNLRGGSGLARVRRMMEHGINIGIATDAANSASALNMFEALRLGAELSRLVTPDFERWVTAAEALEMATAGSAQALGFAGRIGRIATGYKADLVFLDLDHINYVPLGDLARQITYSENGAAVESVMIGGRMVLDHGHLTTIDEAKLRREAREAAARLFDVNTANRELAARLEPFVGQFCRSLACRHYHVNRLADAPDEPPFA